MSTRWNIQGDKIVNAPTEENKKNSNLVVNQHCLHFKAMK